MNKPKSRSRFGYERDLLLRGCNVIAGVDEAGRGPLAGPVAAAAVCFPREWIEAGVPKQLRALNDSKQLTPEERERFYEALTTCPGVRFAIALSDVEEIDRLNILYATHEAMNRALAQLMPAPEHVLVDGLHVRSIRFPQTAIVKGDSLSYSIAAASVLAKVTRDRLMLKYHQEFPAYGFADHKGYGTEQHFKAIKDFGPCPIHRRSFSPMRPDPQMTFLND